MAKVGPDNSEYKYTEFGEGSASQNDRFNTNQNALGEPNAMPSVPPPDYQSAVTQQPSAPHSQFIRMPEPGPVYQPAHAQHDQSHTSQPHFLTSQPPPFDYQSPTTIVYDKQDHLSFTPMPESVQPFQPSSPTYQPSTPASHTAEVPSSYQELRMAQDPSNRFRTDIFQSTDRLNALKSQILEREGRLNELQRRSELLDDVQYPGNELLAYLEQEMTYIQSYFRAAQQHLKEIGEKENFIPGTTRKKRKIHNDHGSCCGTEDHYYGDLCDKKPKIHIEGICNSPDVFAQTCEQQHRHTGWIWGKQKLHIDGLWISPKVHLKGLMLNPVILVEGMWCNPEIHLEGICLNPEIRIDGMCTNPSIRITGLCHNLKIYVEGISCRPSLTVVGICDRVETSLSGMCIGVIVRVTGACKNLKRSLGVFSPSVTFQENDMKINV